MKLADGVDGFVPEAALKKRLDSDRFLWENLGERERVFAGAGDSVWVVGRWLPQKGCGMCEGVSWVLGTRWGGKAADGIDCSGVVFMSYLMNGVLIWRDAEIVEGYP